MPAAGGGRFVRAAVYSSADSSFPFGSGHPGSRSFRDLIEPHAGENQASDRAHRIGQSRTVTPTRMPMRHTTEEKMTEPG